MPAKPKAAKKSSQSEPKSQAKYPRHSLTKALRIPRGILEQNAGRECSEKEAASFSGMSYSGEYRLELSSSIKYGLLERPTAGRVALTSLAKENSSSTGSSGRD